MMQGNTSEVHFNGMIQAVVSLGEVVLSVIYPSSNQHGSVENGGISLKGNAPIGGSHFCTGSHEYGRKDQPYFMGKWT